MLADFIFTNIIYFLFLGISDDKSLDIQFQPHNMLKQTTHLDLVFHSKIITNSGERPFGTEAEICSSKYLCQKVKSRCRTNQEKGYNWDVYDISFLLAEWQIQNETLEELYVQLTFTDKKRKMRYSLQGIEGPLLVFSNGPEDDQISQYFGHLQSEHRHRRYAPQVKDQNSIQNPDVCQPHSWELSFAALDWDWVIQPKSYFANYCKGQCLEPMPRGINATNHAIVKAMYRHLHANDTATADIPPACCVPVRLNKMSLLYMVDNLPYVRRLSEMQADYCACV